MLKSIHEPETILGLRQFISEGETVVFVGSSGVGKSSLVLSSELYFTHPEGVIIRSLLLGRVFSEMHGFFI
ncbi:hypothetical protein D0T60_15620 [Bacteroides sp. 224]|nr:hypothetical protein [Bacteroides sp. 224]